MRIKLICAVMMFPIALNAADLIVSGTLKADSVRSYNWILAGNGDLSGTYSIAMGARAFAYSYSTIALGQYNLTSSYDGSPLSTSAWQPKDPLFVVGNGTGIAGDINQYRNAFAIYKDSTTTIGNSARPASYSSVVIGRNNKTTASDGAAVSTSDWVDKDPLFVIGNGTGTTGDANQYRNALAVYKDGTVTMSKAQGDILMGQFGN